MEIDGTYDLPRILIVTSEWSAKPGDNSGIHIKNQANKLMELGATVFVFSFRGRRNPFRYLDAIQRFRRIDFSLYDVVHAHHGQAGLVALAQKHLPVIVTFHGSDLMGIRDSHGSVTLSGLFLRLLCQHVARRADEVILVADHLKSFIPRTDYHLIPAGIDINLFCPLNKGQARQMLDLPLQRKLVLFVGHPSRNEKRYWLANDTVNFLKDDMDIEMITIHDICQEQVPIYMNACDVLLVTSSNEGSPNAVKEALACNLPVVSTNVGDIKKRIGNIDGCFVCEDDSLRTIAAAVEKALKNVTRIHGRETVLELDERLLVQNVIALYEKARKSKIN